MTSVQIIVTQVREYTIILRRIDLYLYKIITSLNGMVTDTLETELPFNEAMELFYATVKSVVNSRYK